jgi:hypothetical protein
MRILIDECLNWRLSRAFVGHFATSARKMGWSGIKNGQLLTLAVENKFDVFLTVDRNLQFQQNLSKFQIAVVILEAKGVQLHQTIPLVQKLLPVLPDLKPGTITIVAP